jgi:hypothetical protein
MKNIKNKYISQYENEKRCIGCDLGNLEPPELCEYLKCEIAKERAVK